MADRLSAADRNLLLGAFALILVLSLLIGNAGIPETSGDGPDIPSTYSAKPGGAAAAYELLDQLHYSEHRWEEPPAGLANIESDAILIFAEPAAVPTTGERGYLRRFVENGGRVLFCGGALPSFFANAQLTPAPASAQEVEFPADLPSSFTRGARKLVMAPRWFWEKRGPDRVALYGGEQKPVAVVWRMGRGEVLWWAAATPLSNRSIAKADNLTAFLDAVAGDAQAPPRPVYWDEYFHGSRGSLWGYVESTPLKWALLQCLLLSAAILFAFSRRSGPIVIPAPATRLSPLEFVDTLGGLYQRAGATAVATGVAYRHLRFTLTRRFLMASNTPDATLAQAAAQRLGWNGEDLARVLEQAEASQHRNLRAGDALHLVKNIGQYLDRLANRRRG